VIGNVRIAHLNMTASTNFLQITRRRSKIKTSKVIKELAIILSAYGDVEVYLQNTPKSDQAIQGNANFFIVQERYDCNDGTIENICNIRDWLY